MTSRDDLPGRPATGRAEPARSSTGSNATSPCSPTAASPAAETWDDYVAEVQRTRQAAGQPLTRWSAAHLLTALDLAVRGRGWPADHAATALLHVAADPATRSPARLAEAGPWWDPPDHDPTSRTR